MEINAKASVQSLTRIGTSPANSNKETLRDACQEFEALLMQNMLKGMRATVPESGLLDKDASHDMYADLIDIQVARGIAGQRGGMGIADALYRQLQKLETGN